MLGDHIKMYSERYPAGSYEIETIVLRSSVLSVASYLPFVCSFLLFTVRRYPSHPVCFYTNLPLLILYNAFSYCSLSVLKRH